MPSHSVLRVADSLVAGVSTDRSTSLRRNPDVGSRLSAPGLVTDSGFVKFAGGPAPLPLS